MCDFVSWGKMRHENKELGLKKGQLIWLTDDMAKAKMESIAKNWTNASSGPAHQDWEDWVGHSGLARYFGIIESDFIHHESTVSIPSCIAKDVNAGKMIQFAIAYGEEAPSWKFNLPGHKRGMKSRLKLPKLSESTLLATTALKYPCPERDEVIVIISDYAESKGDDMKKACTAAIEAIKTNASPWGRTCSMMRIIDNAINWGEAAGRLKIDSINFSKLNRHVKEMFGLCSK